VYMAVPLGLVAETAGGVGGWWWQEPWTEAGVPTCVRATARASRCDATDGWRRQAVAMPVGPNAAAPANETPTGSTHRDAAPRSVRIEIFIVGTSFVVVVLCRTGIILPDDDVRAK